MKEHISITIEARVFERLRRYASQERRPVSQVVELAVEEYLGRRANPVDTVVTSPAAFQGRFSREETYAGR